MASRLSEDPSRTVLLLEAGPAFPADGYPPELTDSDRITRTGEFTWGYRSEAGQHAPAFDVAAARMAGGGSAVNAGNIRRPRPDDFARWAGHGVEGWSFDEVQGTYMSIENTSEGDDGFHGRTGPLPVRKLKPVDATQTQRAFVTACAKAGFTEIEDYDGRDQHGVALMAMNVTDGIRMNAGIVYLTAAVRARANLAIQERVQVDRIEFEGRRAVGVRLTGGELLRAGEVILSAGVYGSPAVLMRSGIGPAPTWRSLASRCLRTARSARACGTIPCTSTPTRSRTGCAICIRPAVPCWRRIRPSPVRRTSTSGSLPTTCSTHRESMAAPS